MDEESKWYLRRLRYFPIFRMYFFFFARLSTYLDLTEVLILCRGRLKTIRREESKPYIMRDVYEKESRGK